MVVLLVVTVQGSYTIVSVKISQYDRIKTENDTMNFCKTRIKA
jgi:hypothetical protein